MMKVKSNKKTEKNTVELEIEVSAQELEDGINKVYEREGKNITVPGFRKGKAPRGIIEKRYGDTVFIEDAVNDIYPKAYSEAIDEIELEPVAPAEIEILSLEKSEGFTFKAIVTVKPEVEIKDYKGIEVEKIVREAKDEEVESELEGMQERGARLIEVSDRAAKDGDTAIIDFDGSVDGVAFDGGKAEGHELVLGSKTFIDNFEEQIIDKNIGDEFDVNVTFPEQYHVDELAGKPAVFKVKLHELKEKELPELDDEFAKDVSEFDTLDELRADLKKNIQERNDRRAKDEIEQELVTKAIENLEGDIPEAMYENRVEEMVNEFSQQLASQGLQLDLYLQYTGMDMDSFKKSFRERAEEQVKIRLALEKIADLENIVPTEEDYNEEYKKIAEMYGMDEKNVRNIIPEKHLALDIKSNKAIDILRDNAVVKEISEEEAEKKAKKEAEKAEKEAKKAAEKEEKKAEKKAEKEEKKADKED